MEKVEGGVGRSERMDKGRDGEQGRREGHAPGHVLGSRAWTEKDHGGAGSDGQSQHGVPAAKGTFPLSCFDSHQALQGFFHSIPAQSIIQSQSGKPACKTSLGTTKMNCQAHSFLHCMLFS